MNDDHKHPGVRPINTKPTPRPFGWEPADDANPIVLFLIRVWMLPWVCILTVLPNHTGEQLATFVMWVWTFIYLAILFQIATTILFWFFAY